MIRHALYLSKTRISVVFAVLAIWAFFPVILLAQAIPTPGTIHLTASPSHPAPQTEVTFSLDDYSTNTLGYDIMWSVNRVEVQAARNERSLTIQSGDLGEEKVIAATLTKPGAPTISTTYTIKPVSIDIIIEADTYVPSFYNGRALPSAEASVRAIAVVQDGKGISWNTYSYRWRLGETILSAGAVKGKYAVDIIVPRLPGSALSVEVYDLSGNMLGRESISLGTVSPFILLYEHSPLRGLMQKSLSTLTQDVQVPTTIYAEPYFLKIPRISADNVVMEWQQNNIPVTKSPSTINAFVIQPTPGESTLRATLTTKDTRPQQVQETIVVTSK